MSSDNIFRLTLIVLYAIALVVILRVEWHKWKYRQHLKKNLYENPIYVRDAIALRVVHAKAVSELWESCKSVDRPLVVTLVHSQNGDGGMATSNPKGWTNEHDYSRGSGLDTLKAIAFNLGQCELHNKNVISTIEVLLQQEHERVKAAKAVNTLINTTN